MRTKRERGESARVEKTGSEDRKMHRMGSSLFLLKLCILES